MLHGGPGERGEGWAGGSTHRSSSLPRAVAGLGPWQPSSLRDAEGGRRAGAACSAPAQTPFKKKPKKTPTTRHQGMLPSRSRPRPNPQYSIQAARFHRPLLCPSCPLLVKALLQSSSLALWALPNAGFEALGTGKDKPGQATPPCHRKPTARQRGEPPRGSRTACPALAP